MPILCYHSVSPDWQSNLSVTPEAFEQHCRWLTRRRSLVELDIAVAHMQPSGHMPSNVMAMTFDDGFADFYEHALPSIVKYRVPCTVFLVAGTLLRKEYVADWIDETPAVPQRVLTLDEVLELRKLGIQFGSHSYAHHDLSTLSDYECELDLRESRVLMEDLLSTRIRFLAYPRGIHNERVRRGAQRAGFTHAFAMMRKPQVVDRYALPRVGVYRHNGLFTLEVKSSPWYIPAKTGKIFSATFGIQE